MKFKKEVRKQMKRSIVATILAATLLVSMVGMVAGHDITTNPQEQGIPVGGIGTYTLNVTIDSTGAGVQHVIFFDTLNDLLLANLTGQGGTTDELKRCGNITWTPAGTDTYSFTYKVQPQNGIAENGTYPMRINDSYLYQTTYISEEIEAKCYPMVTPLPEITTIALVGIGLIGLVALGRRRT